jgi:hypothetical protein
MSLEFLALPLAHSSKADKSTTSLVRVVPPLAGDARAFLLLVWMLIRMGEALEDVENAAVTVLAEFMP